MRSVHLLYFCFCFCLWLGITNAMFPWSRSRSEYGSSSNRSPLLDDSEYDQVATSDQQPDHISYPPLSGGANNPPAPTPASNEQNEGYEPQGELAVQDISFEYLHTILGSAYFASPRIRLNSLGTWFAIYLNRKLAYQDNLQWEIVSLTKSNWLPNT